MNKEKLIQTTTIGFAGGIVGTITGGMMGLMGFIGYVIFNYPELPPIPEKPPLVQYHETGKEYLDWIKGARRKIYSNESFTMGKTSQSIDELLGTLSLEVNDLISNHEINSVIRTYQSEYNAIITQREKIIEEKHSKGFNYLYWGAGIGFGLGFFLASRIKEEDKTKKEK